MHKYHTTTIRFGYASRYQFIKDPIVRAHLYKYTCKVIVVLAALVESCFYLVGERPANARVIIMLAGAVRVYTIWFLACSLS